MFFMAPVIFMISFVSRVNSEKVPYEFLDISFKVALWISLFLVISFKAIFQLCAYTSIILLINNSATPLNIGLVNGFSQAAASFVRGLGPASAGVIWTWARSDWNTSFGFPIDYHFVFLIVMLVYFMASFGSIRLPHFLNNSTRYSMA
jgi:hypothetical protein